MVLNKKFSTHLAPSLQLQIEQVLSQIGINQCLSRYRAIVVMQGLHAAVTKSRRKRVFFQYC
ncbi:hypothetical protein D9603_05610 [Pseudoalteromonas sp. PS5]|nr:hypothetical protein D9603_05610 [Pseudoalteromonas sp. PS5]